MNINDIMEVLFDWAPSDRECKGDKLICGDENREIKKLAVSCIATPEVIKSALSWGAEAIITHEPTFYNYLNGSDTDEIAKAKEALVLNSGLTIFRFHDHSHFTASDKIIEGVLKKLEWKGVFDGTKKFTFDNPKSFKDIIKDAEEKTGLKNIRFTGYENEKIKNISMCVGSWGVETVINELRKPEIDAVICGEIIEWSVCEYVRDAAQAGFKKSLFLFGHMGSEKSGMEYVCDYLKTQISDVEFRYFDCGEVY